MSKTRMNTWLIEAKISKVAVHLIYTYKYLLNAKIVFPMQLSLSKARQRAEKSQTESCQG